ncbi:MSHA biogenesis protein MshB [Sulfurifustis variabilis]|uniref:MSHA biogenesis protein MshB n=1 Tax=Sulfurifustis variabilis TaxID=1675686 RepID=A0A1B4VAJ4_9GAMM|nr:type II secretion system protein [Sulfurifustis variabilis]BAU47011.1 MSHA biogenesis protein MshB [Sulfurifustis variabilis]
MNTQQGGFTLIELVMVIVILAILAVTAVPRFVDLSTDAEQAAVAGVAGALGSASAINYGSRKANSANGVAVANCTDVANALQGGLHADYTITAGAIANDATASCTVTHTPSGETSTFVGHGIT